MPRYNIDRSAHLYKGDISIATVIAYDIPRTREPSFQYIFLSEYLPSIRFSEVIIYNTLGMWYSNRPDVDCSGIRPLMDTSTYQHPDVGYGHPP